VTRGPRFVAPHQPRVDWQMWFAALESCDENRWLVNLLARLLQGEPAVLRLLAKNPFPEGPPRYIRTLLYEYRFADRETRRRTGAWWTRQVLGPYCPAVSREMLSR
jgi:lipase maturation factor 1